MKSILVGTVLLSLLSVIYCRTEPCSKPTDAEMKCFLGKGTKTVEAQCKGVDFNVLEKGDVLGSHICQVPGCITALGKDVYTPCNRSDLTTCLKEACTSGANCTDVTADELKCMTDAGAKNGDDLGKHCSGVNFDLLKEKRIIESKVCAFPDCIAALEKDVYTPCKRSDLSSCINQICDNPCGKNVLPDEMKCMEDSASKNGVDISTHCKGVDFDLLKKGEIKASKICEHQECITTLGKDVYVPCNRGDLTICVREACNCSAVSPDDIKCMTDAGTKNAGKLEMHCKGVDFQILGQGNVAGSKICDHPDCIAALGKYVYTPCKRSDLTSCVHSACPMRRPLYF